MQVTMKDPTGAANRKLRLRLRDETAELHEALHHDPVFAALANGTLDKSNGVALMGRLAGFYRGADPIVEGACQRLGIPKELYRYRPRSPRLSEWEGDPQVRFRHVHTRAELAGLVYVLDGATLGAAVLDRASRDLDWIGSYWAWSQAEGPAIWRETLSLIESIPQTEQQSAIMAARSAFILFTDAVAVVATP